MVLLRATKRVLRYLPKPVDISGESETALGDWYVNRLVVDRKPLLILVSSTSLLSILEPARDVRSLPDRLPALVAARLQRLGVAASLIQSEVRAMEPVVTAPTRDRSVVGMMVDFARLVPYYLPECRWDEAVLPIVEAQLAKTPCRVTRRADDVAFPDRAAPELLSARWLDGR